jgi:hypothetical protein
MNRKVMGWSVAKQYIPKVLYLIPSTTKERKKKE